MFLGVKFCCPETDSSIFLQLTDRTFYPLLLKNRVGKSTLARQLARLITERNESGHLSRFQVLNLEFDILESSKGSPFTSARLVKLSSI